MFKLELALKLECPICKQYFNDGNTCNTRVDVALFGVKNFGVCCNCFQEVSTPNDRRYQYRWGKCAHRQIKERLSQLRKLGYGKDGHASAA